MSEQIKKEKSGAGPQPRGPMGMGFGMGASGKPKNLKASIGKLMQYLKPYTFQLLVVIAFAIASTIFAIVSPRMLGNITNQVVNDYVDMQIYDQVTARLPKGVTLPEGTKGEALLKSMPPEAVAKIPKDKLEHVKNLDFSKRPTINFQVIQDTVLLLVALYILSAIFGYIQSFLMTGVAQKITFTFREQISQKIHKLPIKYFDTRTHGEVLSRITNDVDTVSQNLNQSMTQAITSVTTIVGILIMMLSINWMLTIVALLIVPLSFIFIGVVVKQSQKFFISQQKSLGEINGHIEEMYSGHNIVKAFNGEKESLEKFNKFNTELYTSGWKSQFYSGLLFPIMNIVSNLGFVGVAVIGGYLAVQGNINVGDIQAFIQYMQSFTQPIMQTANIASVFQSTLAAAERVFEFLDEQEESLDSADAKTIKNVKGAVEFNNVMFGYDESKTIINGFNASIKPGQRIALVGPTGAGKTTIVNLLMRFYDVTSGSIKVDGVDIRDMKRKDLRKMFGMVLQDIWLFNGTIRENLVYAKPDATEAEIKAIAKAAHIDHFVDSLPGGYDMVLNEEADNISQGEKQLMTIARAMLADPAILILDEATSSVDTRTEVLIQKAMDKLMQGRTSFVIAHRLSTIKNADLILVLKDGNIIEQGSHDDLMAQKGFYAGLYESQFAE